MVKWSLISNLHMEWKKLQMTYKSLVESQALGFHECGDT